jgi:hypothetical protein
VRVRVHQAGLPWATSAGSIQQGKGELDVVLTDVERRRELDVILTDVDQT